MRLIDISHVLNSATPIYPGDYKLTLTKHKSVQPDGHCSYLLSSCFHTGTHVDMPMHFIDDARMAADFPIESFMGRGVLLDVRGEKEITMKPCYDKMIAGGSVVLLFTGFGDRYDENAYFDAHPVVSRELAEFFVSKKIRMLGMDIPTPDYPPFEIHKLLLSNGIFLLENITSLQSLLGIDEFEVIALPLKLSAEASFVRAVCRVD